MILRPNSANAAMKMWSRKRAMEFDSSVSSARPAAWNLSYAQHLTV
jgi:hypothetical protein